MENENTQAVNDAPTENNVSTVEEKPEKKEDVVAYSTYSKVMGTLKKRESELNEVRSRLESIELEKKQAEGSKDEVIQTYREKLKQAEEAQQKLKHQYAWTTLEGQIKTAAMQKGCVNPDKLVRLLDDDDLKTIEVDESFRVNQDDLTRLLEKAKKDHADIGLFKAKSVNVNDVAPQTPKVKTKKVEEMSAAELKEHLLKMQE